MTPESDPHEAESYAERLLRFLKEHGQSLSPLLILPHDHPDPDALAAAFGLQFLARECYGIDSRIALSGMIGRTENQTMVRILRIPLHRFKPIDLQKYRNIALVDTQPAFENNPFPQDRRAAMVIDQHPSVSLPAADLVLVDPDCGATCIIIARALLLQKVEIPPRVATALAYGILSDTLNLYRAVRPDVPQTYLSILHHADIHALARIQNPVHPKSYFVTLSRCIREASLYRRLIVSHLGVIQHPDLVSQMAEFLLTYKQATWSLCTGRFKGRLHVSLRSTRQDARAGEVLRDIFANRKRAGGHGAIAGGSISLGARTPESIWREQERAVQEGLLKRLRIPSQSEPRRPFTDREAI